ncbi:E3 ubiquitin ligase RNF157-like isoform X2 [Hypanus sabinus]|uniref:E3 ubiquitin ligase RNF157-like isoform X2 n=1 Tax=Hypanus sabinus TaxID=79690 RepID=UPI0028C37A6A|nr:E3 ubiquitin ligase RNF157-like isoform X2 [Hypanus sabinus]
MGALNSRRDAAVEELDIPAGSVYRYPPKSGNYFASHFIMGGQTFDSAQPEGFLFGENSDLNFLGARPVTFPYAAPPPQEPVKTLRSLISIRKDTLRLVSDLQGSEHVQQGPIEPLRLGITLQVIRCPEEVQSPEGDSSILKVPYNVEFTFDADAQVAITIYYQATEEFHNGCASYISKDCSLQSETVHYRRGVCQQFCLPTHTIDPSDWMDEELVCNADGTVYPMVIHAVVDEGEEHMGHSHVLLTTFDKSPDGNCSVKPLKQKQVVDGVIYLLQEIYGIENKSNSQELKVPDDELSDNSAECVLLPSLTHPPPSPTHSHHNPLPPTPLLTHMSLSHPHSLSPFLFFSLSLLLSLPSSTLSLSSHSFSPPPPLPLSAFRALLQIRAMRKKQDPLSPDTTEPVISPQLPDQDDQLSSDPIPHGYEVVSLLEALNGPLTPPSAPPLRLVRNGHPPCPKPPLGHDQRALPVHTLSSLDHGTESKDALHLKESEFMSLSQNSPVPEEDEERLGSDREMPTSPETQLPQGVEDHLQHPTPEKQGAWTVIAVGTGVTFDLPFQDSGVTPESENVTLSSSEVMDASSHTPTNLCSSISSPEDPGSSLAQSVMSMASSQLSTDTISSMSGSYLANGADSLADCDPEDCLTLPSAEEEERDENEEEEEDGEEQEEEVPRTPGADADMGTSQRDSEGNAVTEERAGAAVRWWDQTGVTPACDNNNKLPELMGLDNDPHPEVATPGTPVGEGRPGQWPPTPGAHGPIYGSLDV